MDKKLLLITDAGRKMLDSKFAQKGVKCVRIYRHDASHVFRYLMLTPDEPLESDVVFDEQPVTLCIDKELLDAVGMIILDASGDAPSVSSRKGLK